ncbi:hypothetical protein CK203_014680 [Vitis vinifera]|uniref:Uncharacterized protein n=1 Tax=Vitis vinifera TaxID=29760 RepID=A0A438JGH3_VITVI|nr:hypothetical protein CK203_014680 [Vitis vinifera]
MDEGILVNSNLSFRAFSPVGFRSREEPFVSSIRRRLVRSGRCHRNLHRAQLSFSFLSVSAFVPFSCHDPVSSPSKDADLVALVFSCTGWFSSIGVVGSSSRTSKGARDENLSIIPSSASSIPGSAKLQLMGFPSMLSRQNYVETSTLRTRMASSSKLHWVCLCSYCRMFYSNIIEHDLDQSYLQSSLFGIVVKVTPKIIAEVLGIPLVQAPSVSDLEITLTCWIECLLTYGERSRSARLREWLHSLVSYPSSGTHQSSILHLDEMIFRGDPTVSKKEVLPFGILITQICQRAGVVFPVNSSFLMPMGPIDTSSWNRRQGQIKGALGSKKKVCHSRAKRKFGESDADSDVDSTVLAELCARFDALDEKILLNPPYC